MPPPHVSEGNICVVFSQALFLTLICAGVQCCPIALTLSLNIPASAACIRTYITRAKRQKTNVTLNTFVSRCVCFSLYRESMQCLSN